MKKVLGSILLICLGAVALYIWDPLKLKDNEEFKEEKIGSKIGKTIITEIADNAITVSKNIEKSTYEAIDNVVDDIINLPFNTKYKDLSKRKIKSENLNEYLKTHQKKTSKDVIKYLEELEEFTAKYNKKLYEMSKSSDINTFENDPITIYQKFFEGSYAIEGVLFHEIIDTDSKDTQKILGFSSRLHHAYMYGEKLLPEEKLNLTEEPYSSSVKAIIRNFNHVK